MIPYLILAVLVLWFVGRSPTVAATPAITSNVQPAPIAPPMTLPQSTLARPVASFWADTGGDSAPTVTNNPVAVFSTLSNTGGGVNGGGGVGGGGGGVGGGHHSLM